MRKIAFDGVKIMRIGNDVNFRWIVDEGYNYSFYDDLAALLGAEWHNPDGLCTNRAFFIHDKQLSEEEALVIRRKLKLKTIYEQGDLRRI